MIDQSIYTSTANLLSEYERRIVHAIAREMSHSGALTLSEKFVTVYLESIVLAMRALGRPISYLAVCRYGVNIEPLIRDYLKIIIKPYSINDIDHEIKVIQAVISRAAGKDKSQLRDRTFSRSLPMLALWMYCRDNALLDDPSSGLVRTYRYNFAHYKKLVGLFLAIIQSRISPDSLNAEVRRIRKSHRLAKKSDAITQPKAPLRLSDIGSVGGRDE